MPKRSGDQEPSASSSRAPPQKKTRFVDPSEDPANFEEQVESSLEQRSRKGRVKNEGYDSDSSDDGEGVVLSRRKDEDDEDEDMFATDKDKKNEDGGAAKKKKEEYLRLGDIEGQVFNDESGEGSDSEENEPEDEDDAERRKKAGMGFEMSSFNMRDEMDEGKFTEDGTYVRTFDPHGVHDRWMEGVDEREIKQARRRKRRQEKEQNEKIKAEEKELAESGGIGALNLQLLALLNKGETVLEALQRLGVEAKKSGKKVGKQKADATTTPIETITHLASTIMSLGDSDIYSKTYEELVRAVRSSGLVAADWVPPSNDKTYEYKWRDPAAGDEVFGPFGKEDLMSWFRASYFGSMGEKVQVREAGSADWGDWDDFM